MRIIKYLENVELINGKTLNFKVTLSIHYILTIFLSIFQVFFFILCIIF
jgi:hypothetical protein